MTPEEYAKFKQQQQAKIDDLQYGIYKAREKAEEYIPNIEDMRPAKPEDIKIGAIIYGGASSKYRESMYWNIVEELLHYGDDWKAYVSDGSRYGLHNAWVRKDSK